MHKLGWVCFCKEVRFWLIYQIRKAHKECRPLPSSSFPSPVLHVVQHCMQNFARPRYIIDIIKRVYTYTEKGPISQ